MQWEADTDSAIILPANMKKLKISVSNNTRLFVQTTKKLIRHQETSHQVNQEAKFCPLDHHIIRKLS